MLTQILPSFQYGLLAQIGNHVDRVELGNLGECALLASAPDDVAGIDQMLPDDAVEGCPDLGIDQVQLGQGDLRLSPEQLRLGARLFVNVFIDRCLRRRILLYQLAVPDELGLCINQRCLCGEHLGLSLLQLILILVLLDREEEVVLFDELAVLVMDLVQIALDARDQLHGIHSGSIPGHHHVIGDALCPGLNDGDRRGWLL
jgi:hypothetical protein